ncbi:MAG: HdeD family acid-resistance protein [Alphaproteobacteria bacterium]
MAIDTQAPATPADRPGWGWFLAFGVLLVVAGVFALANVVLASVTSAIIFGAVALVGGGVQVVHAFSRRRWQRFLLHLVLGLLYAVAGIAVLMDPLAASFWLTLLLGAMLIAAGIVRIALAIGHWREGGPMMLVSGIAALALGVLAVLMWPYSGLWLLGTLLGVDLILHGAGWIGLGMAARRVPTA